jgi:L-aminopeptidase/D-esterase-like protein
VTLRNLITDVAGLRVGQADDAKLASGVTAIVFDQPAVVAVDVRGGAPGTRETDLLDAHRTVEKIDAVVLSGGSAFGLDAATGVQAFLREKGRGFAIGGVTIPIVSGAVLFDMTNGGDKKWGRFPPYRDVGHAAAAAAGADFALGTAGAGHGGTTVNLKGGLGSASAVTREGYTVGAIVAINACGSVTVGDSKHFWAAPFEAGSEFGGHGFPAKVPPQALIPRAKGQPGENTTIALVATDAALTKTQVKQLAVMAQDGLARAIYPVHTTLDGDTVFAAATGVKPLHDSVIGLTEIGAAAANVLARAIARGVYEARALPFSGAKPAWKDKFGRQLD